MQREQLMSNKKHYDKPTVAKARLTLQAVAAISIAASGPSDR